MKEKIENFPIQFYYPEKIAEIQWSNTPQGKLNIDNFLIGKPYWETTVPTQKWRKRTLVFADWRWLKTTNPDENEIDSLKRTLQMLLDNDFTIYIWLDDELKPFTKATLNTLGEANNYVLAHINPILQQDLIQQAMSRLELTRDQLHLLDGHQVEQANNPQVTHSISVKQLSTLSLNAELSEIATLLTKANPPLRAIEQTEFSEKANHDLRAIQKKMVTPIVSHYTSAQFTRSMLNELRDKKPIKINEDTFLPEHAATLHTCEFDRYTMEELQQGLTYLDLPNLKKLTLTNTKIKQTLDNELHLNTLQALTLENVEIALDTLHKLLKQTANIENLTLINCKLSGHLTEPMKLDCLKQLEFSDLDLNEEALNIISDTESQIQRLKITNCNLSKKIDKNWKFNNLTELSMDYSYLSADHVETLLTSTPKLNALSMTGSHIEGNIKKQLSFPFSTTFRLGQLAIKSTSLKKILNGMNSPNILDLTGSRLPNGELEKTLTGFSSLNVLNLHSTHITTKSLLKIIVNHPELKLLDLTTCEHIDSRTLEAFKSIDTVLFDNLLAPPNQHLEGFKHRGSENDSDEEIPVTEKADLFIEASEENTYRRQFLHGVKRKHLKTRRKKHDSEDSEDDKKELLTFIDANTHFDPYQTFRAKRIFYPDFSGDVRNYRFAVYNQVDVTRSPCRIGKAFFLKNTYDEATVTCDATPCDDNELFEMKSTLEKTNNANYFVGIQQLNITKNWQPIASLRPNEVMKYYSINPQVEIELRYSRRDNQYLIRNKEGGKKAVQFTFLLAVPKEQISEAENLPGYLNDLIEKLRPYTSDSLTMNTMDPTGKDYLDSIIQQRKGDCRHRSIVFMSILQKEHPDIPVRLIANEYSMLSPEVSVNETWVRCDLGGYSTQLKINDSNRPKHYIQDLDTEKTAHQLSKHLTTWEKTSATQFFSLPGFCQSIIQGEKKQLIEFEKDTVLDAVMVNLYGYCIKNKIKIYLINSPDDLICSATYIERTGDNGVLRQGPGGPLHDFLKSNEHNPSILLVNFSNFKVDDIIRFNGLLDDIRIRHADGTRLPQNTLVVGLTNINKPTSYQGEDFYSRFDNVIKCPLKDELIKKLIHALPSVGETESPTMPVTTIDMYHGADWKEQLLGHWTLKKDKLVYQEGELVKALQLNLPIEIKNAPWYDDKFKLFLQQTLLTQCIDHKGLTIPIPQNLKLFFTEGYPWDELTKNVQWKTGLQNKNSEKILNPTELIRFFSEYECHNKEKTLSSSPGFLARHPKDEPLVVNLTRTLNEDEWAKFLVECNKHQITLVCHVGPAVTIPTAVSNQDPLPRQQNEWTGKGLPPTIIIESTDIDTTVAQIVQNKSSWKIIDVSECEAPDLLTRIQGSMNKDKLLFEFEQKNCVLYDSLANKEKIILKGVFSNSLVDTLAPLLMSRQRELNAGQLILVTSPESNFTYLPTLTHTVTLKEKKACLASCFLTKDIDSLDESLLAKESLSQSKARLIYFQQHRSESKSTDNAWEGYKSLPSVIKLDDFNAINSKKKSAAFTQKRLDTIQQILKQVNYVYITGLTGVGKTTFVEKFLNNKNYVLYQGEQKINEWVSDRSKNDKILFIDEANMSNREWSEFEGLFNTPPSILIQGQYHLLTEKHKVVFAGNPLNYSNERKLATLFIQHGNALLFEPMPLEFVYEEIIKPVFWNTVLESKTINIASHLLVVYRFLCELSNKSVLISPREIQMMALLTLDYCIRNPKANPEEVTQHFVYFIGKNLVSNEHRMLFDKHFTPKHALIHEKAKLNLVSKKQDDSYFITPSRQEICQSLDDLLALSVYKQTRARNEAQKYGGLGGIVLEGKPGIGKSELVIANLLANGYQDASLKKDNPGELWFYRIPVSMPFDDKEHLLLKAFHEGAIVVIDEINSSPMMERLLNALLMGQTPAGERPDNPGFFIIGTQNPVTMAGRRKPSEALARRMIKLKVDPYSNDEMQTILSCKGVEQSLIPSIIKSFLEKQRSAQEKKLTPEPTFRDLLRFVQCHLELQQLKEKERKEKELKAKKSEIYQAGVDIVIIEQNPSDISLAVAEKTQQKKLISDNMEPIKNNLHSVGLFGDSQKPTENKMAAQPSNNDDLTSWSLN